MDYVLNFDVIWRNLDRLAYGLEIDLYLAIVSIFMGSLIGLVVAFALLSKHRTSRAIANIYVKIIRNVPL